MITRLTYLLACEIVYQYNLENKIPNAPLPENEDDNNPIWDKLLWDVFPPEKDLKPRFINAFSLTMDHAPTMGDLRDALKEKGMGNSTGWSLILRYRHMGIRSIDWAKTVYDNILESEGLLKTN